MLAHRCHLFLRNSYFVKGCGNVVADLKHWSRKLPSRVWCYPAKSTTPMPCVIFLIFGTFMKRKKNENLTQICFVRKTEGDKKKFSLRFIFWTQSFFFFTFWSVNFKRRHLFFFFQWKSYLGETVSPPRDLTQRYVRKDTPLDVNH